MQDESTKVGSNFKVQLESNGYRLSSYMKNPNSSISSQNQSKGRSSITVKPHGGGRLTYNGSNPAKLNTPAAILAAQQKAQQEKSAQVYGQNMSLRDLLSPSFEKNGSLNDSKKQSLPIHAFSNSAANKTNGGIF